MVKRFMKSILTAVLIFTVAVSINKANATENKYKITQDDMIYFIMTDRFYDGDKTNDTDINVDDPKAFHGGDFQGIIDKLDYIKDLGFTAIWITPVVQNQQGGYH